MAEPPFPAAASLPDAPASALPSFSWARLLISLVLSLGVLALIGYYTYEPESWDFITRSLRPSWLLLAGLLLLFQVLLSTFRLRYISHNNLRFTQALRGQIMWDFSSIVTPSVIGGAPFAALFIAKDTDRQVGEITAIMLFAMLMDQVWFSLAIPLLFGASFFVDVYPDAMGNLGAGVFVGYFIVMLLWVTLFAYSTLIRPEWLQRAVHRVFSLRLLHRFRARANREMVNWKGRAKHLRTQPARFFITGASLSAGVWICRYLVLLCIVRSVHPALEAVQFFFRTIAMLLGALILPTPGGAGGIEGMYVLFLGELMPKAVVAPTLLLWRTAGYYLFLALGLVVSAQIVRRTMQRRRAPAPGHS